MRPYSYKLSEVRVKNSNDLEWRTHPSDSCNGLHIAAGKSNVDTVVYLIEELEMDPAVEDHEGRNVISVADDASQIEVVEYLTEKFPKVEIQETSFYYDC